MSLVVVGSMAFDDIETPFGKSDKIVGGAATYIAWSASNFSHNIKQISVVGGDFPQTELNDLHARGVDLAGVQVKKDQKSFYWSGKYHMDMNTRDTLDTQLNVLADFNPVVPESYQDCEFLMLGNLVPAVQMSVIRQLKQRPRLVVMDTMNFWMQTALEDLEAVIGQVDVLLVNDSEARELSGQFSLVKAARTIMKMGPKYLIIKKESMEHCCSMRSGYSLRRPCRLKKFLIPLVRETLSRVDSLVILHGPVISPMTI